MKNRIKSRNGFTLIELIATIAIAGIIMIMILPYFQSGITESHRPAQWLQDAVTLQRTMENMNAGYQIGRSLTWIKKNSRRSDTISTLDIGPAGSSFNNNFGVYAVLENGFISFNGAGNEQLGGTADIESYSIGEPYPTGVSVNATFYRTVIEVS